METQFTEGEWEFIKHPTKKRQFIINAHSWKMFAKVYWSKGSKKEASANAKLIAAAPLNFQENVNTVNELKAIIEDIGNTDISLDLIKTWAINRKEKLEQAIKKATK